MAQPTAYSRQYNFTNFQSVSPSAPPPGDKLDLEFNTVKATLDQVLSNLALIQRDDTALANNSVGLDQLKDEVVVGINAPAPWVTLHNYVTNDTVTYSGVFYLCAVSHVSGTFATDLAASKWSVIIDFNAVLPDLATSTHAAASKTTPVDADELPLVDSAASWALKKVTWANLKATIWTALGPAIAALTGKTTPIDADGVLLSDSAASGASKFLSWANLKATLLTWMRASVMVGTVSQSGGTPTGTILEKGSNANGEYVKFADGTMICRSDAGLFTGINPSTASGGVFINTATAWTFPVAFAAAPSISGSVQRTGGGGVASLAGGGGGATSTTSANFNIMSSTNTWAGSAFLTAIGRWY